MCRQPRDEAQVAREGKGFGSTVGDEMASSVAGKRAGTLDESGGRRYSTRLYSGKET